MFNFLFKKRSSKTSQEIPKLEVPKKSEPEDVLSHPFFTRKIRPLNIDITYRCALKCPHCGRQTSFGRYGKKVPGRDLTLEEIDVISDHFKRISFCGQYSDPIHHPQFIEILKLCYKKRVWPEIHVASSHKPREWFIEAFKAHPNAMWIFGIDGMPEESHKYRYNQDGVKLFNIMLESKQYLFHEPHWQYIVFRYNQHNVDKAMKLAADNGLMFELIKSARWDQEKEDDFKPTIEVSI